MLSKADLPKRIPVYPYKINASLNAVIETIERYIKEFDLDLDPDFQRGHVWTEEQKIKFVEFIMTDGKCPPIYFNFPDWMNFRIASANMVIVDGKQRITAIMDFFAGKFPVFGHYVDDIDPIVLRGGSLEFCVNNLTNYKDVLQWYLELNEGQVAHTKEELDRVKELMKSYAIKI